jgi:endonuclease/exonuclease/phosphatase (EEP) superfamily protein YafD
VPAPVVRSLLAVAALSLSTLSLSTLALAPVASATSADRHPGRSGAPRTPDAEELVLRDGSFNIRAGVTEANFEKAIDAFKGSGLVDVVGMQEIGSNDRNKYLRKDHTWGYYRPPQLQQNPVIWRRATYDFVSAQGYLIAHARNLHGEHSGDDDKGDSYATAVRLVQRASGQQLTFINVHLVRGAVKGGRPAPGKPNLFKLYTDQVAGLVKAIKDERARQDPSDRILVQGDFNVGYVADAKRKNKQLPYKQLSAIGLTSMWKGSKYLTTSYGTHQDALIDQVWTTGPAASTNIVRTIKESDHSPAVATYALPAPPDGYVPVTGTVGFQDTAESHDQKWIDNHHPVMSFELTGDLAHGYVGVEVVKDNGGTAVEGKDFWVDDSGLYDTDLSSNAVLVEIFPDRKHVNPEDDETFTLRLKDPVNTTIIGGQGEAIGTILSNKT